MKKWSDNCPSNFLHKYLLVEAELARLDGNNAVATDLYDAAIESAGANGFVQNEAIANECAGRFWLARGKHDFAALYLERARRGYARWGARRKVWEMNAQYPDILAPVGGDRAPHADTPTIPVEPMPANVDLEAVFRASTALSQEIDLDRLLERVVDIILRNSGARRMALAIEHDGEYFIEAEGRFDDERSGVRTKLVRSVPYADYPGLPVSVISYVARTGEPVWLDNAAAEGLFVADPYIRDGRIASVACNKLRYGKTATIGYLENADTIGAFTPERMGVVNLLARQVGISLDNARLYRTLEESNARLRELDAVRDRLLRQYEESRQKNLQDRMRPHFLYNAINTVHSLIATDPARADEALMTLSGLFRYLTDVSFEPLVPFSEAWGFTESYLEFEKLRFPRFLTFTLNLQGDFSSVRIPPLSIQPLVENAIKHGLRKKERGGIIDISAEEINGTVIVSVSDNGPGPRGPIDMTGTLGIIRDRLLYHFGSGGLVLTTAPGGGGRAVLWYAAASGRPAASAAIEGGRR